MANLAPGSSIDVVIIGNGPSSMILSYILHGNVPYYNSDCPHPDPLLHAKLKDSPLLLHLDIEHLTDHFEASRFSYSTQALPVNVLLDALGRPLGDDDAEGNTCIQWRHVPEKAVTHAVFGNATKPGGQWAGCVPGTTWDIQALSYADMLSLPGYSFAEHHRRVSGTELAPFTRPSRCAIASYLAAYPDAVGISDAIHCPQEIHSVSRTPGGFYIGSHQITCKRIVLASGIFSESIPARPLLQPLLTLPIPSTSNPSGNAPLLVIGSGFSAADFIISSNPDQKILHIYKWDPENKPSPLKACHYQAYPEYAGVYRLMRRAAKQSSGAGQSKQRPILRRGSSFLESRDWQDIYEGLPNTVITGVAIHGDTATISLCCRDGSTLSREVSGLAYAVGRRSTFSYLDKELRRDILGQAFSDDDRQLISGQTLRAKVLDDLEVARGVFVIGSLTGDSLIRFAYGSCVYTAGKLVQYDENSSGQASSRGSSDWTQRDSGSRSSPRILTGIEGHNDVSWRKVDGVNDYDDEPEQTTAARSDVNTGTVAPRHKSWWNWLFWCSD
ncbi:hypothetical protein AJ80_03214 [Polytolypa hystricis UAMH7299]|uniref:L-ornithine N(5)-oxygenase n=1 Tax=Polytolypa hystricis (strain UAMH7299) TaxID=1447883 RepID=A0A2B7YK91_POLH7|nr:hypothetical protein AJ80_03214 [Polytolypa hystricis UAMH7299]